MSQVVEEELMEDLAYDEAEGAADMGEEEGFDEYDAAEGDLGVEDTELAAEDETLGAEDEFEEEGFAEEGFEDRLEEAGEEAEAGSEESMEDAMAYALGAEDSDEFFRRLRRGIRTIGRTVGRVARVAAPIARLIPHPYAQIAARGLNLLGRLRAEGATEDDALDAFAEYAAYDESAVPIVAGIAARNLVRTRGARLPLSTRRALVRGMTIATRTLAQRRGPRAVRALPRIVRSVRRTAAVRRTPVSAIPSIVRRSAATVVRSGRLTRRLSRPIPTQAAIRARRIIAGMPAAGRAIPRSFMLRGPVRISITTAA